MGTRNLTEEELGQIGDWTNDIDLNWVYSSAYDLYYKQHGDTNVLTYLCTEGKVTVEENGEKIYTVTLKPMTDYKGLEACTVALKRVGNEYEILSCMQVN